jgi:SAM-dependent methyltransferase
MTDAANLRADAFAGTAEAYARYRPPYPTALLEALVAAAAPSPPSALLDLACGPGRIALDLAASFDRVCAVDLEPEMIAVGQREASRRGIGNVAWSIGPAEAYEAPAATVDLIAIGEAFHRLDQAVIVPRALRSLKPGGCLVSLGSRGPLAGEGEWQAVVAGVARLWMTRAFPRGWAAAKAGAATGPAAEENLLRRAGFVDVASREVLAPHAWTVESIVGYCESTSVCSRKALGSLFPDFETDLRTALAPHADEGHFREDLRFGFTLGRKPRP